MPKCFRNWCRRKDKVIIPTVRKKKKKTCCQKYGPRALCIRLRNCFCRWICRRIRIWCRRKIFGIPKPILKPSEFELDGVQLDKLKKMGPDIDVLFKKNSKLSMNALSGDIELIKGLNVEDIKKKFALSGSKTKLLESMMEDYKDVVSLTGLKKKSKVDTSTLDRQQLTKILDDYSVRKRKNKYLSQKKFDLYRHDPSDIKKELSLSPTKKDNFDKMLSDIKSGKIVMEGRSKKKVDKEELNKMLEDYENKLKKTKSYKKRAVSFSALKSIKLVDKWMTPILDIKTAVKSALKVS